MREQQSLSSRRRREHHRGWQRRALWVSFGLFLIPREGQSFSILSGPRIPPSINNNAAQSHRHRPYPSYKGYPDEFDQNLSDENDPFNLWDKSIRRPSEESQSSSSSDQGGRNKNMVQPVGIDGNPIEAPSSQGGPSRVRAGFDKLFAGMPSMSDILGGGDSDDDEEESEPSSTRTSGPNERFRRTSKTRPTSENASWFEEEKRQIENNYQEILDDMLQQLEEERRKNPDAVPANAVALAKSVLNEELERELEETRERRARERLDEYELLRREEESMRDIDGPIDASLQRLMDESEAEFSQREASQSALDEFLRYEAEAFRQAASAAEPAVLDPGTNLDEWALERLKAMASNTDDSDDGQAVLDILEENVKALQSSLEKQSIKGSLEPESMKEWQMYRAIATRLAGDEASKDSAGSSPEEDDRREQRILAQLESWKDFIEKEAGVRAQAGLARGPKLPFEWQESSLSWDQRATVPDSRSRVQFRKDINRMSIEAMESLLETSDPSRKENLRRELEFLKSTLESRDYLDIEMEEEIDVQPTAPVDLSDVFSRDVESSAESRSDTSQQARAKGENEIASYTTAPVSNVKDQFTMSQGTEERTRPPDTPFFSDFSETENAEVGDSKLGTMDEQKLNAMFRRSGVRSKDEQEVIRRQWEDFKRIEQAKRMESGLSTNDGEEGPGRKVELKYNVSEVIREDGDIDAAAVLAAIGPRPKRSKPARPTEPKPVSSDEADVEDPSLQSSIDEEDVRDSLYRAVAAIGGGRYKDDPEVGLKQQASFEEFLLKEENMRQSLDELDETILQTDEMLPVDDEEYAEEVLSSLGPRPKPKRTRIIDEGEFSDKGGVLALEDEDDESDVDSTEEDDTSLDAIPEWLRRERDEDRKGERPQKGGFLGSDISDVFDDDYYDRNMRQLHEYEQRRTGRQRQMGIDISDVLGRRDTDDYADYKFDDNFRRRSRSGWGTASFDARKRDLLQYTELDLMEVNLLMDHKDSVYSTGVSQYLPRINKPFKEFGAVFRLEGVLVDITGLQFKAWSKVAEEFGFRAPTVEEVRRASVIRPEAAVREAFFWTDDIIQCREAAVSHKLAFHQVFDEWRDSMGIAAPSVKPTSHEAADRSVPRIDDTASEDAKSESSTSVNESSFVGSSSAAWAIIAKHFGMPAPSEEEVWLAASLSAEEAIIEFQWADDSDTVLKIAQAYRDLVQSGVTPSADGKSPEPAPTQRNDPRAPSNGILDETAVMESHYFAWKKVAERFDFEEPDPEAAMAAFVINDPKIAIMNGFGWTDNPELVSDAMKYFQTTLDELLRERAGGKVPVVVSTPPRAAPADPKSATAVVLDPSKQRTGPSSEELLEVEVQAWSSAARAHGFPLPTVDVVKLTRGAEPDDAIRRLLRWSDDAAVVSAVAGTFQTTLDELTRPLMRRYGIKVEDNRPGQSVSSSQSGPTDDDIFRLALDAWTAVASKYQLPAPDNDQVMFALTVGPEEAILTGFQWTEQPDMTRTLLEAYKAEVGIRRQRWSGGMTSTPSATATDANDAIPPVTVATDVAQWVQSLHDVEMPCVVVSFLEQNQLDALLVYAGLSDLFDSEHRVSATNGYTRESQQYLGAALRCERRPDHCVVFGSSPQSSEAAHENQMQSVCVIGPYPRYELLAADATSGSFAELTAMNVRRLFGERIYDQPQLETQTALPAVRRQPKTKFWDEDVL